MLSLLPLLTAPASAVDVTVVHRGYRFSYDLEAGQTIDETWEDVLDLHRPVKRRGDLRVVLSLVEDGDTQLLAVRIDEISRKGATTVVANPMLRVSSDEPAELLIGGELPFRVRPAGTDDVAVRYVSYGTRVLVGNPPAQGGHHVHLANASR